LGPNAKKEKGVNDMNESEKESPYGKRVMTSTDDLQGTDKSKTIGILMGVLPPLETDPVTLKFFPCTQENGAHDGDFVDTPEMNAALRAMMWPMVAVRVLGREVTMHFIGCLHGLEGSVMKAVKDIENIEGYDELLSIVERNRHEQLDILVPNGA
jgi:hypothetical protein